MPSCLITLCNCLGFFFCIWGWGGKSVFLLVMIIHCSFLLVGPFSDWILDRVEASVPLFLPLILPPLSLADWITHHFSLFVSLPLSTLWKDNINNISLSWNRNSLLLLLPCYRKCSKPSCSSDLLWSNNLIHSAISFNLWRSTFKMFQ